MILRNIIDMIIINIISHITSWLSTSTINHITDIM